MPASSTTPPGLDRRAFLRLGLWSGLGLATLSTTALLSGCSSPTGQGYLFLREGDITLFRALIPVALAGALPDGPGQPAAVDACLQSLDGLLYYSSLEGHKQLQQLFDLLTFAPSRILVAGVTHSWDKAGPDDVKAFFDRWKGSRVGTLRAGYKALAQMVTMSWYLLPQSWGIIGYEPPVKIVDGAAA